MNFSKPNVYIGIMSGTSVDGIDVVLTEIINNKTRFIAGVSYPFNETLRQDILTLCRNAQCSLIALGQIQVKLAQNYAQAVQQLMTEQQIKPHQIRAIGCHGQTVLHHPTGSAPFSMQLVNANVLAAETSITCITDFRGMDIAFGGQGAPLIPKFHQSLFGSLETNTPVVLLNLGGIANLTIINSQQLTGYDTGPSNILLDSWIQAKLNKPFDRNGELSASGVIHEKLLSILLADNYFSLPAPKSTGREYFNLMWLESILEQHQLSLSNADIMATLTHFSAVTITNELKKLTAGSLYVFGGGTQNIHLMRAITEQLPHWQISSSEDIGIESQFMEAMAFSWLGYRCITGQTGNEPNVTGATNAIVMGQITQAPNHHLILGE